MRLAALLPAALVAAVAVGCASGSNEAATTTGAVQGAKATEAVAAPRFRVYARGFSQPVDVVAAPGRARELYVVEQGGTIRVLVNRTRRAAPFLDIRSLVVSGGERGLLGLAFHPQYAKNRRFYVNYTDRGGHTRVVEYRATANGARAIPSSARLVLRIEQPYSNHNGGGVEFGPDGRLYVGTGDGGAGGDPENRAQSLGTLLGKLLRIDVNRRGARPQIVGLGLRNPWRYSFDRATGDLWIGDVGQGAIEEIDFLPARQYAGGPLENYGWDVWEGRRKFEDKALGPGRLVQPVAQYSHALGCSVTGGIVYRGKALKDVAGRYYYGDYCSGILFSMKRGGRPRREASRIEGLTSFGEDLAGELYAVSHNGNVYRLAR